MKLICMTIFLLLFSGRSYGQISCKRTLAISINIASSIISYRGASFFQKKELIQKVNQGLKDRKILSRPSFEELANMIKYNEITLFNREELGEENFYLLRNIFMEKDLY